jgi:signal transduction histidine kinase
MDQPTDAPHYQATSQQQALPRLALLLAAIAGISLLHYLTPLHLHYLHDIFQRLYYLPIILAAFWFGLRGGLGCSLIVSIVYAPHLLFQWGGDPALELEKYLEVLLYNIVGAVTGLLAQRDQQRSRQLQRTAQGLADSYRQLQLQSERIMTIEEQLRQSEKLSTLGEMAAVLAHEIRNPLGSIRVAAEILRDDYRPGNPKHEFLEIQIKETDRLNRVVEDFLRMARQRPQELHRCRLHDELETIVTLTVPEARRREVALTLIPAPEEVTVCADGEKLRQALLNLVINALQACQPGGKVTIGISQHDTSAEIRISDTGPGISLKLQQRIFEPFFTTKPDGTGLGLAVAPKIIISHNGSLRLEDAPGQGACFIIGLPLAQEDICPPAS